MTPPNKLTSLHALQLLKLVEKYINVDYNLRS